MDLSYGKQYEDFRTEVAAFLVVAAAHEPG
jgi:hypothetical protein